MSENGLDLVTESIDPRIQIELERLNSATDAINKLEVDLDDARVNFRMLLCDSAARLDSSAKKLGSCIEKARPYYEARMRASEAAREAQEAAIHFERANSAHSAAREMVYLAEQGLGGRCTLDPAWQEMLNHATQRVNEAETARAQAATQHSRVGRRLEDTTAIAQRLQRDLRRSIAKSSLAARRNLLLINILAYQHSLLLLPYFEMKAQFNHHLEMQKVKVQTLEKQVSTAKLTYAEALRNLEQISDEIHQTRQKSKQLENVINNSDIKKSNKCTKNRYSDPIGAFNRHDTDSGDAAVFYNQTYLPETQNNYKCEMVNFDEFKSLPPNISPKSTPIKVKNPEDISGYRNLNKDQFYGKKTTMNTSPRDIEMKTISSSNYHNFNEDTNDNTGLVKSNTTVWTEINLNSSSPEDGASSLVDKKPISNKKIEEQTATVTSASPKKRILSKQMTLPAEPKMSSIKSKIKLDSNISNWISRSSAKNEESFTNDMHSGRRQSLDNILGPTGEKVKEIFSQGMMMLNISSLTERRNSEPKYSDVGDGSRSNSAKKIPSPLEKTLTYLTTSNNEDDTTGSDTDSLASCDMLTDEQIQSLMLDRDIDMVCEQLLGTPIAEICPKLLTTPTATTVTKMENIDAGVVKTDSVSSASIATVNNFSPILNE